MYILIFSPTIVKYLYIMYVYCGNKCFNYYYHPPQAPDDAPAYIEYCTDGDGSVKGVVVNRSALLSHCRSLTSACNYTEGEVKRLCIA